MEAVDTISTHASDMIADLRAKLAADPYNVKLIELLSDLYLERGDTISYAAIWEPLVSKDRQFGPEVILKYENIVFQNRFNREFVKQLIKLHLAEGCIADVLHEIDEFIDHFGHDDFIETTLLKLSHDFKDAVLYPVLDKAVRANPRNSSLVEVLAGLYLNAGHIDKAIALYELCLTHDADNSTVLLILADLAARHGDHEKSAAMYSRALGCAVDTMQIVKKIEEIKVAPVDFLPYRFVLAKAHVQLKVLDKALEQYHDILKYRSEAAGSILEIVRDLLKTYPDYPEALFLLSQISMINHSYSEAVGYLNRIVKVSPPLVDRVTEELKRILNQIPEQAMAIQSLAEIYMYQQKYSESLVYYGKMLDLMPDAVDMVVEKARTILKIDPQVIAAREIIAKSYLARKQYSKAADEAEGILELDQNNAGAYLVLARAAYADNDLDEAIRHFKTSLSFDPYSKELHGYFAESSTKKLDKKIMELTRQVEKNAWKYSLRAELGKAFFYRGLLHEAISEFQVAVKDAALVSDVHKMQGLCYKELGRYDLAIQQFQKAIADLDQNNIPERLRLLLYIGLAYEAAGEQQKAVQIYEEIMTQDLNYEHIQTRIQKLNGFSWVEIRGKALSAVLADEEHKRLIPCWAKNSESDEFHKKHKNKNMDLSFSLEHNNNAVEHILKGRYTAATEELVLAEQLDPRFTIAYNNHAVLAMLEGNYDVAEGYLKKALELNPKLSVCSANLGVLAQVRGDKNAAKPYYEKALTLDTTAYTIHINYADVCYDQNDVQKAIVNWNKVLDVGILPELAKRRLKYRQP